LDRVRDSSQDVAKDEEARGVQSSETVLRSEERYKSVSSGLGASYGDHMEMTTKLLPA